MAPDRGGRFGAEVAELDRGAAREVQARLRYGTRKGAPAECRGGAGRRQSVAHGPVTLDRPPQMRFSGVLAAGSEGCLACALEEVGRFSGIVREGQSLVAERDRLIGRA